MAEGQDDDARVQEIRNVIHACVAEGGPWLLDGGDAVALLTRLDALAAEASDVARENEALIEEVKAAGEQITALAAERDALRVRAERAEVALAVCAEAITDGVRELPRGGTTGGGEPFSPTWKNLHLALTRAHAVLAAASEVEWQGE